MEHEFGLGDLTRRGALGLGALAGMAACSSRSAALQPSAAPHSTTPTPTSTTSATTLPAPVRWQPGPGELVPAAKRAAVRRIESLGNSSSRRLRVIDAQYGGLLSTAASVLVVCASWTVRHGVLREGGHTYDVRLTLSRGRWQVTAIYPSRPGPAARRLSTAAKKVLVASRIGLPYAARADIASGQIHDSVLETMLRLSQRWTIDVSVIRSGHPLHVFGTDRLSDHPRGRAFDTWRINGSPVVSAGAPHPAVPRYMEALAGAGSYNVGGPVLLGSAPQFFSDRTHHDHVHAGFSH